MAGVHGGHWLAAAPPTLRAKVDEKIFNLWCKIQRDNQPGEITAQMLDNFRSGASRYEAAVFSQSENAQDYLRTISKKMLVLQRKAAQAASNRQAHLNAAPPQVQSMQQIGNRQAQAAPMAPVGQLPPPVTRMLTQSPARHDGYAQHPQIYQAHGGAGQQSNSATMQTRQSGGQSNLTMMDQQNLRVNQRQIQTQPQTNLPVNQRHNYQAHAMQQLPSVTPMQIRHSREQNKQQDMLFNQQQSHQAHAGQQSHVAPVQIGHSGLQNNQQFRAQPVEVDWREDMFRKITSLKDAHFGELVEFQRALGARVAQWKAHQELESLPKEQADKYRKAVDYIAKIGVALRFLQLQKSNIPEAMKDKFDQYQSFIYNSVRTYRGNKGRLLQNHREPPPQVASPSVQQQNVPCEAEAPEVIDVTGGSDTAPLTGESGTYSCQQEQNEHETENSSDSASLNCSQQQQPAERAFTGGSGTGESETCSQEKHQDHSADEVIPQLTENVDLVGIPHGQQQTKCTRSVAQAEGEEVRAEAETPVTMEAAIKHGAGATEPLYLEALHRLAKHMGVNLKRAFPHMTTSACSMDGGEDDDESGQKSCCKRRKTLNRALLDEIDATDTMLVETEIRITDDDAGGAEGAVVIEFCYIPVSLATELRAVIDPSEMSVKLLVPADYPQSSPVLLGDGREQRKGIAAGVAHKAFRRGLEQLLPELRSIEGMARGWDECVRRSVVQFAHRLGGGTFGTRYGRWESCVGAESVSIM